MHRFGGVWRVFFCRQLWVLFIICSANANSESLASCKQRWVNVVQGGVLPAEYGSLANLCDAELLTKLKALISVDITADYSGARLEMFANLDNIDGTVCSVYTDLCIETNGIPDGNVMNCEHSWPQSLGATGDAKSDLHHLYPVDQSMNSRRSNHPFCEVSIVKFEQEGSKLGLSALGTLCFEPPDRHKGDLARSMFYFSVQYKKAIDSEQEAVFRKWNFADPVSEKEEKRNEMIESFQGNRNPFVDYPYLIFA